MNQNPHKQKTETTSENIKLITAEEVEFDGSSLIKDELCPKLWTKNNELRTEVHERLLDIANRFHRFIGADIQLEDIYFTGSLAGYGYHNGSDIDIHLLVDFEKYGEPDEVRKLFQQFKFAFNHYRRGTSIRQYPIEVYVQDLPCREYHHPNGMYSIARNCWVIEPMKLNPEIDSEKIKELLAIYINAINKLDLIQDNQTKLERAIKLKDNIILIRRKSLQNQNEGYKEFVPGNVFYKTLRLLGYLDLLFDIIRRCMDVKLSLESRLIQQDNLLNENFTLADERQVRVWVRQELESLLKKGDLAGEKQIRELIKKTMLSYHKWMWEKKGMWMSQI